MSSDIGEDVYATSAQPAAGSFTRRVERPEVIGKRFAREDPRKFKYDRVAGRANMTMRWDVTKDDRLSPDDAGRRLHHIHRMYGVESQDPEVLIQFDEAMFFCHTLNGSSVLQPGRSKFYIKGNEFDFAEIVRYLGEDLRRFFRAYADDVARANQRVIDTYDPADAVSYSLHSQLVQVADERGLGKYRRYAHDTADACTDLTPAVRAAISRSKTLVIGSTVNAADRVNSRVTAQSADGFDSTNGVHVASHGARGGY